jgi:hypothetical protein
VHHVLSTELGRCTIAAAWLLAVLVRHADQRLDAHLQLCTLGQSETYLVAPQALAIWYVCALHPPHLRQESGHTHSRSESAGLIRRYSYLWSLSMPTAGSSCVFSTGSEWISHVPRQLYDPVIDTTVERKES